MSYSSPAGINASKGMTEILNYTNTVTNSWLSYMLLLATYIIVLVGYYKARDDFAGAMAMAGFGTFVVGLFFWLAGFVNGWSMGITIAVGIISIIPILVDNNG